MKLHSIVKSVAGWFGGDRKRGPKPSMRRTTLTLESLEQRDVPSTFGGDIAQIQFDFNQLAPYYQGAPDRAVIQSDINNLYYAAQTGQTGLAVRDASQLQSDMSWQSYWYGSSPYFMSNNSTMQYDVNRLVYDANSVTSPMGPTLNLNNGYASNNSVPFDALMNWASQTGDSWESGIVNEGQQAEAQYGGNLPVTNNGFGLGSFSMPGYGGQLQDFYAALEGAGANFTNATPFYYGPGLFA